MQVDLSDPVSDIIEAFFTCAIISKNDAHSSFVVSLGDRSEPFLACCVPDLQLDVLPLNVDRLYLKVNAYFHQYINSYQNLIRMKLC